MASPYGDNPPDPKVQLRNLMLASPVILEQVPEERIVTRPLKRSGSSDVTLIANEATPQCFDPLPPYWVLPSIVINSEYSSLATKVANNRQLRVIYTVAYYTGPEGGAKLWQMREAVARWLAKKKLWYPGGYGLHIVISNDLSGQVPAPEFPDAGLMMVERISAFGVWRRE